jgi:hypothetical protein
MKANKTMTMDIVGTPEDGFYKNRGCNCDCNGGGFYKNGGFLLKLKQWQRKLF